MSDKTKKNIRMICDIAVSVLLIITGVLLIISCVSIYNLGDRPFATDNISAAFDRIRIPVFITLGVVIIDVILNIIFQQENAKIKATLNKKKVLSRLEKRFDASLCEEKTLSLIKKEKKLRIIAREVFLLICIVALIPALIYILNVENYPLEGYNASVIAACIWVIPCSFVAMGSLIALSFVENASIDRQLTHTKAAIASGARNSSPDTEKKDNSKEKWTSRLVLGARVVILALAVFFIIEGISNGGASDVLIKAINICTECIGLG